MLAASEAPFLIAALLLVTIWGIYLFPSLFGRRRDAPLSSTEEFDRWTHVMADVQRRGVSVNQASARDLIRLRRRRALVALVTVAVATLAFSYLYRSVGWLLLHLAIDALLAWYIGMLMQVRQQRAIRVANTHLSTRPADADEPPVRVVAGH